MKLIQSRTLTTVSLRLTIQKSDTAIAFPFGALVFCIKKLVWCFVNSFNVMVLFGYFCVNASLHSELCAVAFASNYHKNAFMTLNEFTKHHPRYFWIFLSWIEFSSNQLICPYDFPPSEGFNTRPWHRCQTKTRNPPYAQSSFLSPFCADISAIPQESSSFCCHKTR